MDLWWYCYKTQSVSLANNPSQGQRLMGSKVGKCVCFLWHIQTVTLTMTHREVWSDLISLNWSPSQLCRLCLFCKDETRYLVLGHRGRIGHSMGDRGFVLDTHKPRRGRNPTGVLWESLDEEGHGDATWSDDTHTHTSYHPHFERSWTTTLISNDSLLSSTKVNTNEKNLGYGMPRFAYMHALSLPSQLYLQPKTYILLSFLPCGLE